MKNFVTRYYNSLELVDNKIIKTCSTDRVKRETDWFSVAKKTLPQNIPEIYRINLNNKELSSSFEMEYIHGDNLFDWIYKQSNINVVKNVFQQLLDIYQTKIHCKKKMSKNSDIKQMYFKKPLEALKFYSENINGNQKEYIINGEIYLHLETILREIYDKLQNDLQNTSYTLIHGDATFSNTLISKEFNNLYLIDPRGSFGSTKFFGDPRYDYAKIYYSIIGNFDSLNNGNFSVKKGGKAYSYNIDEIPFSKELEKILFKKIKQDKVLVEFIHATIWLSLVPHLRNDPDQMLTAFLHGTQLLNKLRAQVLN